MERVLRNNSRNGPPVVPRPGAVHADGLGDLGDGVLPFPVGTGGGVHAADGGGLAIV